MLGARASLLLSLAAVGCTGAQSAASPRASAVTLSEEAPPAGYVQVRALSVQSGKGCGLLAERGSREDADQKLRVAADRVGASYVQVTARREPTVNHQCLEHEYRVSGVAYRPPAPPPSTASAKPVPPPSAARPTSLPHVLLDFEGEATLGKPARSTERSSVALSLAAGEPGGTALSVGYRCSGGEPQGLLNVWFDLGRVDFRAARALSLRVKPDGSPGMSISFTDGHHARWTQHPALTPGVWQTVTLKLDDFRRDPGPPGSEPGAPAELSAVGALGLSLQGCADGYFLLDDVRLE